MFERDLKDPVARWLVQRGFQVTCEFRVANAYCDLYAVRFAPREGRRIPDAQYGIAVELKVADIGGVLKQASRNKWEASQSYAVMPAGICDRMKPTTRRLFVAEGAGLLRVDGDEVRLLVQPTFAYGKINAKLSRKLWRRVQRDRRLGRDYV